MSGDIFSKSIGAKIAIVSLGTIPGSGSTAASIASLLSAADLALLNNGLELEVVSPTTAINVYHSAVTTGTGTGWAIPAGGSKVFKAADSHLKLFVRSNAVGTVTDAVGLGYMDVTGI